MLVNKQTLELSFSLGFEKEVKITMITLLSIVMFPYFTFIGAYIFIAGIKISNIYSLLLCAFVIKRLINMRYKSTSGYILFFFSLLLYALFSIIWGNYGDIGLPIIFPLITGFLAMAFVASLSEIELKLFLKSLSIFTFIVLALSLFEIFTGKYIFFNNVDFKYSVNIYNLHYPGVVFANPNDLAQFMLVGFPLLIFGLLRKKRIVISGILFIATIFVLINSTSRIALISSIIIVLSYILLSIFKKNSKIIVFVTGITAVFILLPYLGINLDQYDVVNNFLKIDISQDYFTGRDIIYSRVFELGKDNILFGAGLGASYSISGVGTHNMFLFILADLGIFFAFGFVLLLITGFISMYKYKKIQIAGLDLSSIMFSILIVFPLFSSISSGNEQRKIIWVALGLVFAVINICAKKQEHK